MRHAWQTHTPFGGHRFLDFVNTVDDERKTRARNGLPDWPTVLVWCRWAGVIDDDESAALVATPPAEGAAAWDALIGFREAGYAVLSAVAGGVPPPEPARSAVEAAAATGLARATLAPTSDGLGWTAPAGALGGEVVRVRLALAFLDLVGCRDLARLRECGRCTGLYLDHGRGAGRRWCRMSTCGNRAKVERHRRQR
jgi:predicted RNA-binding Zn ribbon-like protein